MNVRVTRLFAFIVDGEIAAHPLIHKILLAVFPHHFRVLFGWHFNGQCHDDAPGKLRVPLCLRFLDRVPQCSPILIGFRRVFRKQDFRVDHALFASVLLPFLLIIRINVSPALVSSSRHGGLLRGALYQRDFKMGAGHFLTSRFALALRGALHPSFLSKGIAATRRKGL